MPGPSVDYLRGGAKPGEVSRLIQQDRTNVNNGYFTLKPAISEAKRMNQGLETIYKEGPESRDRQQLKI